MNDPVKHLDVRILTRFISFNTHQIQFIGQVGAVFTRYTARIAADTAAGVYYELL